MPAFREPRSRSRALGTRTAGRWFSSVVDRGAPSAAAQGAIGIECQRFVHGPQRGFVSTLIERRAGALEGRIDPLFALNRGAHEFSGAAHFLTFWGFIILGITIIEAYGALVVSEDFAFPFFGHARWLGFLEDLAAVGVLVALIAFSIIRIVQAPRRRQRSSRFYGSHTGPAWLILFMITLVVVTLLLYRGAQYNTGHFPWGRSKAPFARARACRLPTTINNASN